MELEKEKQAVKAIRMEMKKYKVDFSITVEDDATKKIFLLTSIGMKVAVSSHTFEMW